MTKRLEAVRSIEPDYTRCRATIIMGGARQWQQCQRRPVATRQHADGSLYRVCRQHYRAAWFFPWTAAYQMPEEAHLAAVRRAQDAMVGALGLGGEVAPRPKLVRRDGEA